MLVPRAVEKIEKTFFSYAVGKEFAAIVASLSRKVIYNGAAGAIVSHIRAHEKHRVNSAGHGEVVGVVYKDSQGTHTMNFDGQWYMWDGESWVPS